MTNKLGLTDDHNIITTMKLGYLQV